MAGGTLCHQRRENSKWSEKNKALTEKLEQQGIMTDHGREKIAEAKKNGQWNAAKVPAVTEDQIDAVAELLRAYEPAYTNFSSHAAIGSENLYTGLSGCKNRRWTGKAVGVDGGSAQ